jgi:hypothetical protein
MPAIYYWADRLLPRRSKRLLNDARVAVGRFAVRPESRSPYRNIYHCCVPRTASRWLKLILSDQLIYRYSGLGHAEIARDSLLEAPPRSRSVVGPLYVSHSAFEAIVKEPPYRAFFVMRDPRDIVVSWYFSLRYSHEATPWALRLRRELEGLAREEGLIRAIEQLDREQRFLAMRDWQGAASTDGSATFVVRYEDLTGERSLDHVRGLLRSCGIAVPDPDLERLLAKYSFARLSNRQPGQEDAHAKYRKGIAGDWRNYFDDRIRQRFDATTGDLVSVLGYAAGEGRSGD